MDQLSPTSSYISNQGWYYIPVTAQPDPLSHKALMKTGNQALEWTPGCIPKVYVHTKHLNKRYIYTAY